MLAVPAVVDGRRGAGEGGLADEVTEGVIGGDIEGSGVDCLGGHGGGADAGGGGEGREGEGKEVKEEGGEEEVHFGGYGSRFGNCCWMPV